MKKLEEIRYQAALLQRRKEILEDFQQTFLPTRVGQVWQALYGVEVEPEFTQQSYISSLPEDQELKPLLGKATAERVVKFIDEHYMNFQDCLGLIQACHFIG